MPAFHHTIRVRYNECDQQDAVFNANYLVYVDVTLTEMWREAFGSYGAMATKHGADLVVAEANVRYLKPARFDDVLDIAAEIERLGTTAITTRFDVTREREPIAVATLRHVLITLTDGTKTPIPDEVRSALERYVGRPSDSG